MLVLVRAILVLAPIGVFALAVPLAARMGLAAAGALAYYITANMTGAAIIDRLTGFGADSRHK